MGAALGLHDVIEHPHQGRGAALPAGADEEGAPGAAGRQAGDAGAAKEGEEGMAQGTGPGDG